MRPSNSLGTARLVVTLIFVGLLVVFTLQNTATIGVDLLFWEFEASGAIFVFLLLAAGIVVGWVLRSLREPGALSVFGGSGRGRDDSDAE